MQRPPLHPNRSLVRRPPLGRRTGPQAAWENQFDLSDLVSSDTEQTDDAPAEPSAYNSDEPLLDTDTDSDSKTDTYESDARTDNKTDPGASLGTAAENAGLLDVKPEEKIDHEVLEILARNFYQLLRMRLEEQQDSHLNRIAGLLPWADIVTFPIMGNSKSTVPKILQTESGAPTFMIDRKINQLSEEIYQTMLSRLLSERSREGWLYSK